MRKKITHVNYINYYAANINVQRHPTLPVSLSNTSTDNFKCCEHTVTQYEKEKGSASYEERKEKKKSKLKY